MCYARVFLNKCDCIRILLHSVSSHVNISEIHFVLFCTLHMHVLCSAVSAAVCDKFFRKSNVHLLVNVLLVLPNIRDNRKLLQPACQSCCMMKV